MVTDKDFSGFKTGAQRLQHALVGIPDRVPVLTQMHEFTMHELGVSAREFYTQPALIAAGTLETQEKFGIDVPVIDWDVYNIEAEALGQAVIFADDHMPDVDRTKPLIRDKDDLHRIKTPDFDTQGRFAQILEMNHIFRRITGGIEPSLGFCAPFSLAANIRGIEQLLMDMYSAPDFVRTLFDRIVEEVLAPYILRLKAEFPQATSICGADASASLPIVSPDIIREWIVPYIVKLRDLCGPEVYVPNWVGESMLKDPSELLDLKLQVCPKYIEGQDPDVAELGPAAYKAYAEARDVPLVLGVGAAFLDQATPAEVEKRVRHYTEVGGRNGRFALYLCNLGATTPPANVRAAIQAVNTWGVY